MFGLSSRTASRFLATTFVSAALAVPAVAQNEMMRQAAATLPRINGKATLDTLEAPVRVTRDARGIVTVDAESIADMIRAQGFVHAQDRFFQMDLQRRYAAGRLSELMGSSTLSMDEAARVHRCTAVADEVVKRLPAKERAWLEWYAEGVNAALDLMKHQPLEYALLGIEAESWASRDSVLASLAMFMSLNSNARVEEVREVAAAALHPELMSFLTTMHGRFESPLIGEREPSPTIPGPEVVDLRGEQAALGLVAPAEVAIGSNNWAIAGSRTADGRAIVANDPHLQLTAPGIWHRMELEWGDRAAIGITYPGSPGLVIGSNGFVAWGVTNTTGDFQDHVIIEVNPDDPGEYRTPGGFEPFEIVREEIGIAGSRPHITEVKMTRWGPIVREDYAGRPLALSWTAHDPDSINFALFDLDEARTVEDALAVGARWNGPSMNFVAGDADGRIGWVVSGVIPNRVGFDGTIPVSWADGEASWDGALPESLRPRLLDPPSGLLYTANNRTVDVDWARHIGQSWAIGDRAYRIREVLDAHDGPLDEEDLFSLQLDSRTVIFDWYRDLIIDVAAGAAGDRGAAAELVRDWGGTADIDEPAVALLQAFRRSLHDVVLSPLVAPCREIDRGFRTRAQEEPVRLIVESRAPHLLVRDYTSWDDLILTALDRAIAQMQRRHGAIAVPWGDINQARVHHPATQAMPQLSQFLNMPDAPLAGHFSAVRVGTPRFGASARLVVSPGNEVDGILHIPAGQSGHPLSPYYRTSHQAWLDGDAVPLKAGDARGVLRLVPGS